MASGLTWLSPGDKEEVFFKSLPELPDRIIGLLCPVIIEDRLERILRSRWHDVALKGRSLLEELFQISGPLGNFGTQIKIAFATGVFGEDVYCDLTRIIKIRNLFAHNLEFDSFSNNEVLAHVNNLKLPSLYPHVDGTVYLSDGFDGKDIALAFVKLTDYKDMSIPRDKFIRTNQIISTFLALMFPEKPELPVPSF